MATDVETKDCTALSDAELAEMADLCADGPHRYEAGPHEGRQRSASAPNMTRSSPASAGPASTQ